jgi:general secretion pathway protein B
VTRDPLAGDRTVAAITALPVPAERTRPPRPAAPRAGAPLQPGLPGTPSAAAPAAPATDLKAQIARLSLQVLGWAPEPRDRFVFINGRKYLEGQAIDDKLLIERIADDSVILSYQGERVTLKGP